MLCYGVLCFTEANTLTSLSFSPLSFVFEL